MLEFNSGGSMMFGLINLVFWYGVSGALAASTMDLKDYAQEVLKDDADYQGAILDERMAQIKKSVASSLWRNSLEITPYALGYKISDVQSLTGQNFDEHGVQWGISQFTPWGTQLRLGYDQVFENNRVGALAKENGLSLSLSQPLWKNQFGEVFQRQQSQNLHQANVAYLTAQLKQRATCLRAVSTYVDAWTQAEKHKFVLEVFAMSEDLFAKGSVSVKRGQISQLDWLGVQSDHINLQTARSHSEQALASSRTNLEKLSVYAQGKKVSNPENQFEMIFADIRKLTTPTESLSERANQEIVLGLEEQTAAERSNALPDLDFKLSQKWNQGMFESEKYRDNEVAACLNLVWKFNDPSTQAPVTIAQLQSKKAALLLAQAQRLRKPTFDENQNNLASLETQIQFEGDRAKILGRITEENKKRFLQGRLEFQDLLRIKEQWFEIEQRVIEKRAYLWKSLLEFALQQDVTVNFCGGRQ